MSIVKFIRDWRALFTEKIHREDKAPLVRVFHLVPDAMLPDEDIQFTQLDLPPVIRPKKSTVVKRVAKKTTKKISKKTEKLVEKKAKK